MQCWICAAPANAICRFCGRAVCRNDARIHPFVLEVYESGGTHYGLAVEDSIHCGVCKPKPDPVKMEFLDEAPAPAPAAKRKRAKV
jgi:hypothetical protein